MFKNILHVNSYYSVNSFYKNLFDKQKEENLNLEVYVPVSKLYNTNSRDFGSYSTISKNHYNFERYIFHLKHSKILKDIQKSYNILEFDIVHAHSLFSNGYVAFKLYKKYKIPYIVAIRDTDLNVFFKRLYHLRSLGIKIIKNAKKIIFLSTSYRDELMKKYLPKKLINQVYQKSIIIPNGVDNYWLNNKYANKFKKDFDNIKILFVGQLTKRKNIPSIVKACNLLRKRGYSISLTVVGKIVDNKEYNYLIKHSFVSYYSEQPKEILKKFYRENDIFVMPSITETFGLVYAEAMSQGLPVIYSKNQGFDGQFKEGLIGYNVNSLNINEIAEKIIKIISDYNQISSNCVDSSLIFDWYCIAKRYNQVYDSVLNSSN